MSVPLWHDQIGGKYSLIESLHLSNKIWRHSDCLQGENVDKSGEIRLNALELTHLGQVTFFA